MEGQDGAGEVEARLADMLEEQARGQVWYGMVWYIMVWYGIVWFGLG